MPYSATLQVRTTLDQAGRIAGLAGELATTEADITRRLLNRALAEPKLLGALRRELDDEAHDQELALEDSIERAERRAGIRIT